MQLALPTAERFFDDPQALTEPANLYPRRADRSANGRCMQLRAARTTWRTPCWRSLNAGKVARTIENDATNGYLHAAFTLIDDGLGLITGGNDGTLIEYETATARVSRRIHRRIPARSTPWPPRKRRACWSPAAPTRPSRLWNLKTHELIVSMFFAGNEWVVWMPQGYYYSSDDGDRLIGWHVNQGRDKEGRFVRAGQLKKYLWSPEMVRRAIILRSAEQAVAEMRPGVDHELERLLQRKPPEFDIKCRRRPVRCPRRLCRRSRSPAPSEAGAEVADFSILSNSRNVGDVTTRSVDGDGKTHDYRSAGRGRREHDPHHRHQ